MQLAFAVVLLVVALAGETGLATAQATVPQPECSDLIPSDMYCAGTRSRLIPPEGSTLEGVRYRAPGGVRWVPYDRIVMGPDGRLCTEVRWKREGTLGSDEVPEYDGGTRPAGSFPACPWSTNPQSAMTPGSWAALYWETTVPLPAPSPRIAPGWGITGKIMYLETNGQTAFTHDQADTPFGPLRIDARGTYMVDWGDGQRSGPHSFEGRPWPHGLITHIYTHVGTYDVVVTERWEATWQFGDSSGVLPGLQTQATIDAFPLRQIQAVVIANVP